MSHHSATEHTQLMVALRGLAEVWETSGAWLHFKGICPPDNPIMHRRRVDQRSAQELREVIHSAVRWIDSATFEDNPEYGHMLHGIHASVEARRDARFQRAMRRMTSVKSLREAKRDTERK